MNKFKYVTPYWRDSQDVYGEGHKIYTGTTFFILNYNSVKADIKINFYDLDGNLYSDMDYEISTPPNSVLDIRAVDIISLKNPNYRVTTHLRTGSIRVYCNVPLVISGKMYNGRTNSLGTQDENVWSIPFEGVKIEDVKIGGIIEPIPIPNPDFSNFFKRKRPGNE